MMPPGADDFRPAAPHHARLPARAALPAPRRHLEEVDAVRAADADDARRRWSRRSSPAEVTLIDEGIDDDRPGGHRGRSGRHQRHHRHGAARLRARGAVPARAGHSGGARRRAPDAPAGRSGASMPTRSSSATPRSRGRQLLRDVVRGAMRPRYDQSPALSLGQPAVPAPGSLPARASSTSRTPSRRRAAASTSATSASSRPRGARPLQKPVGRRRSPISGSCDATARRSSST